MAQMAPKYATITNGSGADKGFRSEGGVAVIKVGETKTLELSDYTLPDRGLDRVKIVELTKSEFLKIRADEARAASEAAEKAAAEAAAEEEAKAAAEDEAPAKSKAAAEKTQKK